MESDVRRSIDEFRLTMDFLKVRACISYKHGDREVIR